MGFELPKLPKFPKLPKSFNFPKFKNQNKPEADIPDDAKGNPIYEQTRQDMPLWCCGRNCGRNTRYVVDTDVGYNVPNVSFLIHILNHLDLFFKA